MTDKKGRPDSQKKNDGNAPRPGTRHIGDQGSLNEGVTDSDKGWEPKKGDSEEKKEK
jgi:hypothetical protein